jgi:hypothetical protein
VRQGQNQLAGGHILYPEKRNDTYTILKPFCSTETARYPLDRAFVFGQGYSVPGGNLATKKTGYRICNLQIRPASASSADGIKERLTDLKVPHMIQGGSILAPI